MDESLNPRELDAWLKELSSRPGIAGSPYALQNAEFVLAAFKEYGWDAEIETFHVYYPKPKSVKVQMLEPHRYDATLEEVPVEGDASSARREGVIPPYLAYGGDGDVTGELVYVNYGLPDDYAELERHGIDVRGKVVIARYGGGWRGLKPLLAQKKGAVGALIYSDPKEDGYYVSESYPAGGGRPAHGVQRGSVLDMITHPGDPLTPGYGSVEGAPRLAVEDAKTILKIPVLPLSYSDASPLLKALQGPVVPERWRGALPFTYKMGPGPAKVRVKVESEWGQTPIYNVTARLKGSELPDEWVIRGSHRDSWVMGADDPLSSTVAMLGEAKAIGQLVREGWRPKRTLIYNSWDGEEAGMLGSTEWVEANADELRRKAVAYINTDGNGRGYLRAGGSHSLQHMINQVAASVTDPQTGANVQERWRARLLVAGLEGAGSGKAVAAIAGKGEDLPISAIGSGSDYVSFLHFAGIASTYISFGGEADARAAYHSLYDTYELYSRLGDPGQLYGVALAQVTGRMVLRMSEADVLPLRFTDMGKVIEGYLAEVHQLSKTLREATATQHKVLDSGAYALTAKRFAPAVAPPKRLSDMPPIDLSPLDTAADELNRSLQRYERAYERVSAADFVIPAERRNRINALILQMEQALTHEKGLPGREWYKHFIYAPGQLTGYGVKTLPTVREALEARRWDEANTYAKVTADVVKRYTAQIDKLTGLLESSK